MLTRDVSKNVLENNLCSKSMGNHFLSIWRTFGLSLTWYTSTKNNSSTFFIQSTTFNNLKLMNIVQISVLKQKFITVSQTLFHGDCQGWLLREWYFVFELNLKGSNSQSGWPSMMKADPNICVKSYFERREENMSLTSTYFFDKKGCFLLKLLI